jgi:hypothetical protein
MAKIFLRFALVVILVMLLVSIISCGGESSEGVVKAFLEAVNAGEFDKAEQYLDSSLFASEFPAELEGNIQKIEIGETTTFGDAIEMAGVAVTLTLSSALYSSSSVWMQEHIMGFSLIKRSQGWKITAISY